MKPGKREDRLRPPLMIAFRQAFKNRGAKSKDTDAGSTVIVQSRRTVAAAVSESELRENLTADLEALLNTTNLESIVDLGERDYVRKSILNYGIYDLAHRTREDLRSATIARELRESIMRFEPRIIPDSLRIARDDGAPVDDLRVRFILKGDMDCDPAPAPVEFIANLEVASGKLGLVRK